MNLQRDQQGSPFLSIALLSVGPIIAQLCYSLSGIVNSIWVARALGTEALSALALYTFADNLVQSFGYLMHRIASVVISGKLAASQDAGQIICDLVRCTFLWSMLIPAVFLPSAQPIGRWFLASDSTIRLGFDYCIPKLALSFVPSLLRLGCGCLVAEGRSLLVAAIHIAVFVAGSLVLDPLFLLVFRWGILGSAFAHVIAQAVPVVLIYSSFFRGRMTVKPVITGFLKPLDAATLTAMKIGLLMVLGAVCETLSGILIRKYISEAARASSSYTEIMAGYGAVLKIWSVTHGVQMGWSMGVLPVCSRAFAAQNYSRWFASLGAGVIVNFAWGLLWMLLLYFFPRFFAALISKDEGFLGAAERMLPVYNIESALGWAKLTAITVLQSVQTLPKAGLYNIVGAIVGGIGGATALFLTNRRDWARLMYAGAISNGFACLVGAVLCAFPIASNLRKLREIQECFTRHTGQ